MVWWAVALRLTGLGWYIAACIVIGILAGIGLDKLLGTRVLFTLIGIILGSIAAFWGVYKMVLPILYGSQNQDTPRKGRGR